jgi:hypothetical protein
MEPPDPFPHGGGTFWQKAGWFICAGTIYGLFWLWAYGTAPFTRKSRTEKYVGHSRGAKEFLDTLTFDRYQRSTARGWLSACDPRVVVRVTYIKSPMGRKAKIILKEGDYNRYVLKG